MREVIDINILNFNLSKETSHDILLSFILFFIYLFINMKNDHV